MHRLRSLLAEAIAHVATLGDAAFADEVKVDIDAIEAKVAAKIAAVNGEPIVNDAGSGVAETDESGEQGDGSSATEETAASADASTDTATAETGATS